MKRVGIYPGTFDPIHQGHLSFALESIEACGLDRVIFLPEPTPRAKLNVAPIEQRIRQIKIYNLPHPKLDVHQLKSSRFTVRETLAEIEEYFANSKLTLLIGSDVALGLHKWEDVNEFLATCDVAIGIRSRETEVEINRALNKLQVMSSLTRFTTIRTNHPSLASSMFRNK